MNEEPKIYHSIFHADSYANLAEIIDDFLEETQEIYSIFEIISTNYQQHFVDSAYNVNYSISIFYKCA